MPKRTAQGQTATPAAEEFSGRRPRRVLAVFDDSRAGRRALKRAAELSEHGELAIVTLAPLADFNCCRNSTVGIFNCNVRVQAREEIDLARAELGAERARTTLFTTLVGKSEPLLAAWIGEHEIDTVVLPGRGLRRRGGHLERCLRREQRRAEVFSA